MEGVSLGTIKGSLKGIEPIKDVNDDIGWNAPTQSALQVIKEKQVAQEGRVTIEITTGSIKISNSKSKEIITEVRHALVKHVMVDQYDKKIFAVVVVNEEAPGTCKCFAFGVLARASEFVKCVLESFKVSSGELSLEDYFKQARIDARGNSRKSVKLASRARSATMDGVHPEGKVIYNFKMQYQGSVPVDSDNGHQVCIDAVKRIKDLGISRDIRMDITPTEVRFMDKESNYLDPIRVIPIDEVVFTSTDPHDKIFSILCTDARLGLIYCHSFKVDKSDDIPIALGGAFSAYAKLLGPEKAQELREKKKRQTEETKRQVQRGQFLCEEATLLGEERFELPTSNQGPEIKVIQKQFKKTKKIAKGLVINITAEWLRMLHSLTGDEYCKKIPMRKIITSYCIEGDGGEKNRTIAVLARTQSKAARCYFLRLRDAKKAFDAITRSCEIVKKQKQEQSSGGIDPFKAISGREPAPKELFEKQVRRGTLKAIKIIGSGQFGQVWIANQTIHDTVKQRAVKTLRDGASVSDKQEFVKEAKVMIDLGEHINMVNIVGVAVQQRPWLCVLEFVQYGDLKEMLEFAFESRVCLSPLEQLYMTVQLADGLDYIHSRGFIHADFAARNVLLDKGCTVKIADFGLAQRRQPGKKEVQLFRTMRLPIKWTAIETLDKKIFSEASDVWSFGITVWEIYEYGAPPFDELDNLQCQKKIRQGLRLAKPKSCPDEIYHLLLQCWFLNRSLRPKFLNIRYTVGKLVKADMDKCDAKVRDIGAILKLQSGSDTIPPPIKIDLHPKTLDILSNPSNAGNIKEPDLPTSTSAPNRDSASSDGFVSTSKTEIAVDDDLDEIMNCPHIPKELYFHGKCSVDTANQKLEQYSEEGVFILRESSRQAGAYTLDSYQDNQIHHTRIHESAFGMSFYQGSRRAPDVWTLIDRQVFACVNDKQPRESLVLLLPLPKEGPPITQNPVSVSPDIKSRSRSFSGASAFTGTAPSLNITESKKERKDREKREKKEAKEKEKEKKRERRKSMKEERLNAKLRASQKKKPLVAKISSDPMTDFGPSYMQHNLSASKSKDDQERASPVMSGKGTPPKHMMAASQQNNIKTPSVPKIEEKPPLDQRGRSQSSVLRSIGSKAHSQQKERQDERGRSQSSVSQRERIGSRLQEKSRPASQNLTAAAKVKAEIKSNSISSDGSQRPKNYNPFASDIVEDSVDKSNPFADGMVDPPHSEDEQGEKSEDEGAPPPKEPENDVAQESIPESYKNRPVPAEPIEGDFSALELALQDEDNFGAPPDEPDEPKMGFDDDSDSSVDFEINEDRGEVCAPTRHTVVEQVLCAFLIEIQES
eukprot:UC4_evm4s893